MESLLLSKSEDSGGDGVEESRKLAKNAYAKFEDDDDFVAALARCAPPARARAAPPLTRASPHSQDGQRDPDAELQAVKGS